MDAKERVLTALRHVQPDKVPFALGFGLNEPVLAELSERLGMKIEAVRALVKSKSDIATVNVPYIGPADRCVQTSEGFRNEWCVVRRPVSYGAGHYDEIIHYPLGSMEPDQALEAFSPPSPDWYDYDALPGLIVAAQADGPKAIRLGNCNPFESAWYMRGFEQMFMDFMMEPAFAHALMEGVTDFFCALLERSLSAAKGGVDLAFTADDIGGQQGLLMSPAMWKEFLVPYHKRINDVAHSFGVRILYHTDGAVMNALEGLCDMGIDVLEALQFDAEGMDPAEMKRRVGGRLSFHGGVSVQSTLPFGSPEDVRAEVEHLTATLGADGGYILAPSHAVQAGSPVDNVLAFFEAAQRPLM